MNEILSKRVILLTNTLLILCAIGFLALIHRVDASFKEKEYTTLNRLNNCIEALPENISDPDVTDQLHDNWLKGKHKDVHARLFKLRVQLLNELDSAGFGRQIAQGKASSGFRISLAHPKINDSIPPDFALGELQDNNKLCHFADQYFYLQRPVHLNCVKGYSPGDLQKAIEKRQAEFLATLDNLTGDSANRPHVLHHLMLQQLYLEEDSCFLVFGVQQQGQLDDDAVTISIPVETLLLDMGSLHHVYQIDNLYSRIGGQHEIHKLVNNYGEIPMDKALELVGEDYMEAYERMEVFGLSISTTSLPLVSLAFYIFIMTGILIMLREAKKGGHAIITDQDNEDLTDYFMKRKTIRFFLWVILPMLSLAASLPHLQPEPAKLWAIAGGTLLLLSLSLSAFFISRKL